MLDIKYSAFSDSVVWRNSAQSCIVTYCAVKVKKYHLSATFNAVNGMALAALKVAKDGLFPGRAYLQSR